jgi:hypothetical protein
MITGIIAAIGGAVIVAALANSARELAKPAGPVDMEV